MASLKFSVSCNVTASVAAGSINFQSSSRKNIRLKPSVKVIAAQVSGAEPQAVEAAGHMKTLYDVLGLSRGANPEDVKTAYRKLARQFHPDTALSPQAKSFSTQMFLQIRNAYAVLSKPEKRAQYDRQLMIQQRRRCSRGFGVGRRADAKPAGHVGRNWETDQCW